ncbi:hypothetical protein SGFS_063140 [Streptomyces graminofaciens]|jgi:hypothetical protein|uniref:Large secreted protein n=1 Tax=Streptomyces graminofaciens TaxID=68212 RepID=A0ABM7FFQ9_9ACTN|nr:hypothetical protein [Streptomyces graminofaciens]BBC35020.1 hypothetical protein SGFS_063140 [Streptomyces graminofaciens]
MPFGTRARAVLASLGTLGLALAASPANAADGTPTTPTQLFNGYRNCSTDADRPTYLWAGTGLVVEGIPGTTDTTGNPRVSVRYQVWPVADPTRITTVTRDFATTGFEAPATLPAAALADGQTYAWQAQTVAGGAASDWSAPCYVTVDNTRPASAPTITSPNYPPDGWNQGGEPVTFTLDAGGVDDVTGFQFTWQQDFPVIGTTIGDHGIPQPVDPYSDTRYFKRADAPGGSATLSLVPPRGAGVMTLWVRSLDRAYNGSAITSYTFRVSSTAPTVTPAVPSPEFGDPTEFTLRPDAGLQSKSPVVGYSVKTVGGQSDRTVDVEAAADGTAKVTLTLDGTYGESLRVTSRSANGWVSDAASWDISYDTTPTVASDVYPENGSGGGAGVPGAFTFTPKVKDVVSYTYSFDGDPEATVTAGADDEAGIDWTPSTDGFHYVTVYATTRSGIRLAPYDYFFTVN